MAYLVLNNGKAFEGKRIGADTDGLGELVFTTGMVGYLETLTDPSFAGQIVIQTFPLIGNYGVIEEDFEGECLLSGYVVREICDTPSNFRSQYSLDELLKKKGIPAICGVDTRELTRIIREDGVMNAVITDELPANTELLNNYKIESVTAAASRKVTETFSADGEKKYSVTLIDCGTKHSLIKSLTARGCEVTAVPFDTSAEDILASNPDGIVISEGPGDPTELADCASNIKKLIGRKPLFGIGLGHQLIALAMGGTVKKLKYGHRGSNQPVSETGGTRTYITSQNHGFTVLAESLSGVANESFVNTNDGTNEGLEYRSLSCFTVQFTPADSGSTSTAFLYGKFLSMMGGKADA